MNTEFLNKKRYKFEIKSFLSNKILRLNLVLSPMLLTIDITLLKTKP